MFLRALRCSRLLRWSAVAHFHLFDQHFRLLLFRLFRNSSESLLTLFADVIVAFVGATLIENVWLRLCLECDFRPAHVALYSSMGVKNRASVSLLEGVLLRAHAHISALRLLRV